MRLRAGRAGLAALVLAVGLTTALAGGPRAPEDPAPAAVPFGAGETLTYDVSWSMFSQAGTITTTVKERREHLGAPAMYIVAEGGLAGFLSKVYHAQYKADTLLDLATLTPRLSTVSGEEGQRRFTKITRFDPATGKAEYEAAASRASVSQASVSKTPAAPRPVKKLDVPPGTQDLLSVLYAFRAAAGYPRGTRKVTVAWNGQLYRADLVIDGEEWIATGLGTLRAWRMTPRVVNERGQPDSHKMVFWFSQDPRHLPLRLRMEVFIGSVDIVLREARAQ